MKKKEKFGSKKNLKAVKPNRVAGVKVRSGVKAGGISEGGGLHEFGGPGGLGDSQLL